MSRVYLVTGSASGIGRATRELLEERGNRVIGVDITGADVEADLSSPEGREYMVSRVTEVSDGVLDGVLAVAGVSAPNARSAQVNYFGAIATLTGLRPLLAKSSAPRAVAVSSLALVSKTDLELLAAFQSDDEARAVEIADSISGGDLGGPIYITAKWAVASWVRHMAPSSEWAGAGISLNAIAPGLTATSMTAHLFDSDGTLKASQELSPMPLNGPAQPLVVARLLAWLAGEENSHLCGQIIFVDGGTEALRRGDSILTLDGSI
jgi:NAD(P)-dependent dehydrogenase (short-subunit alcohol dehydrogenase family)